MSDTEELLRNRAAARAAELEYMDDCDRSGMLFDPDWQNMLTKERIEAEQAVDADALKPKKDPAWWAWEEEYQQGK